MTTTPTLRLDGPGDVIETVPFLLGFHPTESIVLLGLRRHQLVVTMRVDLAEVGELSEAKELVTLLARADAECAIAVIFTEVSAGEDWFPADRSRPLPFAELVHFVADQLTGNRVRLVEALLVADHKWWSYFGDVEGWACWQDGKPLPRDSSPVPADAVFAGLYAHPNRAALLAVLDPLPDVDRQHHGSGINDCELALRKAANTGHLTRERRSTKRALFAAAREADGSLFTRAALVVADRQLCRFGVGLAEIATRDALWLAIDQNRIDGRGLWQVLLQRLPPPYDAAPLFLYGWAAWRDGNGALAMSAAERALASSPGYTAAELLHSAVASGLDPYRTPRLRLPARD